jgi:glycerol-3-phosphate dehydrogenase
MIQSPGYMNRKENIRRLQEEVFDLCIIGGGASGAGCALDAALRGLKVALVEKEDFAAETSGRSTKLVHGGVRYLEQAFKKLDFAQLRQVRHGLEERSIVLKNAPHLAHTLGLITPVFSWWEGFYFSVGLKLYDWFAPRSFPSSRWLSKHEALAMMPGLSPRIHSAVLYFDGQLDDARYCLALVQSASEEGAVVVNHLEVLGFQHDADGKIIAATLKDNVDHCKQPSTKSQGLTIRARQFLNCTGPYADHIRHLANPDLLTRIRPSKGVHLILPGDILSSEQAMLIPKTCDGRMVFAIPFNGNLLLGTTDEPYAHLNSEPVLEEREVDFLLETLQPFVGQTIKKEQVKSGFGGIRPLLAPDRKEQQGRSTKSMLRDHVVERDPASGLISLLGGKWTTYRLMARDAVNEVFHDIDVSDENEYLNVTPVSQTEDFTLAGAENFELDFWKKLYTIYGFEENVCQHLAQKYGSRSVNVAQLTAQNPELAQQILPDYPFLIAEILFAVQEEMALTIRDFLARRIRLEIMDWEAAQKAAPVVAKWMGESLGWTTSEQQDQLEAYLALLDSFILKAKPS